jgi:hypothetical protein
MGTNLASADVIIAAPASFTGSAQRIWRITRGRAGWPLAGFAALALLAVLLAWALVACWYLIFGLWLVPYRVIRRGQRQQKLAQIRHREMLDRP